jgi:hypothetical protein
MKSSFSINKPNNPIIGDMYFDTIDNCIYCYDGSNWVRYKIYRSTLSNRVHRLQSLIQSRVTS